MSYAELFAMVTPLVEREGAALFGRQMTLGPATEFCVLSTGPIALPEALAPLALRLRPVWPPSGVATAAAR